jgi:hypothetical protein
VKKVSSNAPGLVRRLGAYSVLGFMSRLDRRRPTSPRRRRRWRRTTKVIPVTLRSVASGSFTGFRLITMKAYTFAADFGPA